jgi:hypothetical protein
MPFLIKIPWTRMQSHESRKEEKEKKKVFGICIETDGEDPKRHRLCPVVRIVLMPQSMNA